MARNTDNVKGLYLRGGVWHIDCRFRGQRLTQAVGPDKTQAIDVLRLWKTRVTNEEYFPNRAQGSLTCTAVLSAYWTEHLQHTGYAHVAKFFLDRVDSFFGSMAVKNLTEQDVADYSRTRGAQKNNRGELISSTTTRHELGILLQALRHCATRSKSCKIQKNPLAEARRPKGADPKRIVLDDGTANGEQWQALYSEVCAADRGVVLCLFETAMRPAEVFSMRWSWVEQVTPDLWLIRVPAENEKTSRGREIPISPSLLAHLKAVPRTNDVDALVFPNHYGKERHDIRVAFGGAVERAGLQNHGFTPYCLRRTRVSIWDSIDPAAARIASGHSPLDVHELHYVRIGRARLFRLVGLELAAREEYKVVAA